MTSTDITWLLDVDCVVNADRPGWGAAPFTARVTDSFGQTWRMRWAPALLSRIKAVRRGGRADVVWCTTWCPDAHLLERLWGLPELPRAWVEQLHGYDAREAKVAAARKVIADGRRLIWTDDDAFPAVGPLFDELTADGRALLIKPDPRRGLQPVDMDSIDAFVVR